MMNHLDRTKFAARRIFSLLALAALSCSQSRGEVNLATVAIGNPGNDADAFTGLGKVDYPYEISKYEVTMGQYCEFLNATGRSPGYAKGFEAVPGDKKPTKWRVKEGMENMPFVTSGIFYSAVASEVYEFLDWLNGRETYSFEWAEKPVPGVPKDMLNSEGKKIGWTYTPSKPGKLTRVIRNSPGDKPLWVLANRDECFKAAFHDKSQGLRGVYFTYATGTNFVPMMSGSSATSNVVNYSGDGQRNLAEASKLVPMPVGASTPSSYGVFDLTGNVPEVLEGTELTPDGKGGFRSTFGGSSLSYTPLINRFSAAHSVSVRYRREATGRMAFGGMSGIDGASSGVGLRLVKLLPTNVAPEAKVDLATSPIDLSKKLPSHLAMSSDGDVWLYQLRNTKFELGGLARAIDILLPNSKEAIGRLGAASRGSGPFYLVQDPRPTGIRALARSGGGIHCKTLINLAGEDAVLSVRKAYNKVAPKGAQVELDLKKNPVDKTHDISNPYINLNKDYVLLSRTNDSASIEKMERAVVDSLNANRALIWYFSNEIAACDLAWDDPVMNPNGAEQGIIMGINLKTHEFLVRLTASEENTPMIRIKSDRGYATTIGLYQLSR